MVHVCSDLNLHRRDSRAIDRLTGSFPYCSLCLPYPYLCAYKPLLSQRAGLAQFIPVSYAEAVPYMT